MYERERGGVCICEIEKGVRACVYVLGVGLIPHGKPIELSNWCNKGIEVFMCVCDVCVCVCVCVYCLICIYKICLPVG